MELENLNREYLSLKSKLRDARSKENTLNNRLTVLSDEKIIINGKLVEAKRNNDQAEIKRLNQELKQVNDDIADLKSEAVIQKEEIDGIRSMINARVNEVRNNVALQYHLDSALTTRYSRQLKKSNEEKQEILKKRNELVSLSQLLNNHRTLMNNAKASRREAFACDQAIAPDKLPAAAEGCAVPERRHGTDRRRRMRP